MHLLEAGSSTPHLASDVSRALRPHCPNCPTRAALLMEAPRAGSQHPPWLDTEGRVCTLELEVLSLPPKHVLRQRNYLISLSFLTYKMENHIYFAIKCIKPLALCWHMVNSTC